MKPSRAATNILHKQWRPEVVQQYIGSFRQSYFAYAGDELIREHAASGGVITAIAGLCPAHQTHRWSPGVQHGGH